MEKMTQQDKLLLELNEAHSKKEKQNKELSAIFKKDLNEAQYKKDKALSDDAYPDNAHFIYEIIQNAEDATYNINKKAILRFFLLKEGILVLSNQDGFSEDDVRSICVMASGDKIAKKDQFIGEKGLGFRSVFKITDTPCISSNGYRFYFDKKQSYEKPFLLKNYPKRLPKEFKEYSFTSIFLPYSINKNEIDELENDFKTKINPKIILFLKKLNLLSIVKDGKKLIDIQKKQEKNEKFDLVTLLENNKKQKYYLIRKTINTSHINEEKRINIKEREIVLAFPEKIENTISSSSIGVFAFLPTEIYSRLNFIMQADFLLDTSRGQILENEWNKNLFKEIEIFLLESIKFFKEHFKLKYNFLNYFLQHGKSGNKFIDNLFEDFIKTIENKNIILSDNETWQKPENIILLEDAELETKYIKLLFGENYEQVHKKFELNKYFIDKFNIKKVDKKEIIEKICDYFDKKDLNDYDEKVVLELTKFLSKYLNTDSRALSYERKLYIRVKESLPIIPKYKINKKFYSYGFIYLSSEYKPDIIIENFVDKNEFDFDKYNFLADDYKDNKRLEDFIKKIIDEQKENRNRKTIDFFVKYPEILQKYLLKNKENNYKEIFDFLLENVESNQEKIAKINLLLTQNSEFLNASNTVYFSNDNENNENLNTLDKTLLTLIKKEHKYKEFLQKVFKVKEADILNIILNEYLPKIKEIAKNRNEDNDKILLKYTKKIIENFDKFEKDDKEKIKKSLFFISTNQREKYLKPSSIYLSQNLSEIIFDNNSIEKYITDKSFFDFIDNRYIGIAEKIDNDEKVKDFFTYIKFEKNIKEEDIPNFIKLIKQDLSLNENIEALEFIAKSIDSEDRKKISELENFKVYSQSENLVEIKNIFLNKVDDLNIEYLHENYKQKIGELNLKNIKQYFQSEFKIEPFINYLKQNIDFNEAIKVYKYLDYQSNNNIRVNNITPEKIRKEFKNSKLIYNENSEKFYPDEVTWQEEKSNNKLVALSTIYPNDLQNFFIKKVQVSQTKDIRQIINQLKQIKEKNNDYYDLLIDLNNLININEEIDKYYDSFSTKPPIKNKYEDMRKFILEKEGIFILDNGKKNKEGEKFYFNDLNIDIYENSLKKKVFSVSDSKYPVNHFSNIIDVLGIKRLSNQKKEKKFTNYISSFNIRDWRELLHFAYDLLFTKYKDKYDKLEDRAEELKEINLLNSINIYEKVETYIDIDGNKLKFENKNEKYLFKNKELKLVNENLIFKIIAEKIGYISDKELKDFYKEVLDINAEREKEEYYKDENVKEKLNFVLEISNEIIKNNNSKPSNKEQKITEYENTSKEIITKQNETIYGKPTAEEERDKRRQTGAEQVVGYNKNVEDKPDNEISPPTITNKEEHLSQYNKKRNERIKEISNRSKNISNRTRKKISNYNNTNYKFGEEETKDFFRRKDQYLGQCQICGFTFRTKNGTNYCERFTWSDYKKVKVKTNFIDAGNSLCLCARCHSIIKGGGDFEAKFLTDEIMRKIQSRDDYDFDTFIEDINSDKPLNPPDCFKEHIDFEDIYFVDIRLNNKNERIYFTEEHLLMFFGFLKSKNSDEI